MSTKSNNSPINSASSQPKHKLTLPVAGSKTTQAAGNTGRKSRTPVKTAFAPKYLAETWYDLWRNRQITLTKIVQRNPGLGLNDVEAAVLDEADRRDRVRERVLERQTRPHCTHRFRGQA